MLSKLSEKISSTNLTNLLRWWVENSLLKNKGECVPSWFLDKVVENEIKEIWEGSYVGVPDIEVSLTANIIGSHKFFMIKIENNWKRLKARPYLHVNRDDEKGNVAKNSFTAQIDIIRFVASIGANYKYSIAAIRLKGAFLQSGRTKRVNYLGHWGNGTVSVANCETWPNFDTVSVRKVDGF